MVRLLWQQIHVALARTTIMSKHNYKWATIVSCYSRCHGCHGSGCLSYLVSWLRGCHGAVSEPGGSMLGLYFTVGWIYRMKYNY